MDYIPNIYDLTHIFNQHPFHAYKQQPAYYFISNLCKKSNLLNNLRINQTKSRLLWHSATSRR